MLTQRVDQVLSVLSLQRHDLTTSSSDIRIDIECLLEMIDRCRARHSAHVEENADVGLQNGSKSVEEPTVGVYLLLTLFFEAEDDLDGD